MKILIILGHPDTGSLNHAIAHAVRDDMRETGHDVVFHDLYAERFDPLLVADEIPEDGSVPAAIQTHCDGLCSADGIVIVHPNWWGQPPAILKGWIEEAKSLCRSAFGHEAHNRPSHQPLEAARTRLQAAGERHRSNPT